MTAADVREKFQSHQAADVMTIVVRYLDLSLPFLLHFSCRVPLHQAQQIQYSRFIFRINRRDRSSRSRMVLMAASTMTSLMCAGSYLQSAFGINLQFNMQAVIFQQMQVERSGIATVTDEKLSPGVRNVVSFTISTGCVIVYRPP